MVILGIGSWLLLRRSALCAVQEDEGSRPPGGASAVNPAHLIVAATAATWATLHIRGPFTPTIVVLGLLASFTALQLACSRWLFPRARLALARRSALGREISALAASFVVFAVFALASYPLAPGLLKPQLLEREAAKLDGGRDVLPNVIVIVLDMVRADHLSTYGYKIPTKSPSLAIRRAGVSVPKRHLQLESAASFTYALLTGLLPHQPGAYRITSASSSPRRLAGGAVAPVTAQPPLDRKSIATRLQEHGYETGLEPPTTRGSLRSRG